MPFTDQQATDFNNLAAQFVGSGANEFLRGNGISDAQMDTLYSALKGAKTLQLQAQKDAVTQQASQLGLTLQ